MEAVKRACLIVVALAVPTANFFLLWQTVYGVIAQQGLLLLAFNILSVVVGLAALAVFGYGATQFPMEVIAVSLVMLLLFLVMSPVFRRAEHFRQMELHRKALKRRKPFPTSNAHTNKTAPQ